MSHRPKKTLLALGTALLGLCASAVLATPALAQDITLGNLTFSAEGSLEGVVSYQDDVVSVAGSDEDITVTMAAEPTDMSYSMVVIGGDGSNAYLGTITFDGIDVENLQLDVFGSEAVVNDSVITAPTGVAAIQMEDGAQLTLGGNTTITGGGGNENALSGAGISGIGDTRVIVDDPDAVVSVVGGSGVGVETVYGTPCPGGNGILMLRGSLEMTQGTLTAKAGDTTVGTGDEPNELPVGLTVGTLSLQNGTGVNGEGPTLIAYGWPRDHAAPLPVSGIDAGTPNDDDFYPWVLQASNSEDAEDPFIVDFAGSGNANSIDRNGWTYFSIGPRNATGLQIVPITSGGTVVDSLYAHMNLMPNGTHILYRFGVAPIFEGLEDAVSYQCIQGSQGYPVLNDLSISPADAVYDDEPHGYCYVNTDYTGDTVTVSAGSVDLPTEFTTLYPNIGTVPNSRADLPIVHVDAVYRLYNEYAGTHLYTTDAFEVLDCTQAGWTFEGPYWLSPTEPAGADAVICRLFNPYNGDHYYVDQANTEEIDHLLELGWVHDSEDSNIVSLPADEGAPIYTLFNPYSSVDTHLWTPSFDEVTWLQTLGWQQDSTSIYGYQGAFMTGWEY